ncbi:MAG: hypothetical protein M1480_09600 [Bacteroidetes bacterium]|nr:hypothetical protein [Bacteroidota bacterium]
MKRISIILSAMAIFVLFCTTVFAQQDYQIVQSFKEKQKEILQSIKNANSNDDLNQIQTQIDQLKNDYESHKDLLDKSLYPDDFNGTIDKLNNELQTRKDNMGQITNLQTQISQLKSQIDSLNTKNAELITQIQQMQEQNIKDIAKLEQTIRELRSSMMRRDRLIMSMLGGLLPPSYSENGKLTSSEKEQIYSRTKKSDIIANIKRSIDDNVKFLQVTTLNPEDLSTIKRQQTDFEKMWKSVGPEIVNIYSSRKEKVKNIQDIDSAFSDWRKAIDHEAWNSIRQRFLDHEIPLDKFSNGEEFSATISSYINDQIADASANGEQAKNNYAVFADTVWSNSIKPLWIPFLIENNLFTNSQLSVIDTKIYKWKSEVSSSPLTWIYIIIGIVIIAGIISLVIKSASSKKKKIRIDEST